MHTRQLNKFIVLTNQYQHPISEDTECITHILDVDSSVIRELNSTLICPEFNKHKYLISSDALTVYITTMFVSL